METPYLFEVRAGGLDIGGENYERNEFTTEVEC